MCTRRSVFPFVYLMATFCGAQSVAPPLTWGDWQPVPATCETKLFVAASVYDGRNDVQVRFKMQNATNHFLRVEFDATAYSASGQTYRQKGFYAIMRAGATADRPPAGMFSMPDPFPTPVNQPLPIRVTKVLLENILEATDMPLPNRVKGAYLDVWKDYVHHSCGPVVISLGQPLPTFATESVACYAKVPIWSPSCQAAVDDLPAYSKDHPSADMSCLLQWKAYQQCYEVYAFNSNPSPRPQCAPPPCSP